MNFIVPGKAFQQQLQAMSKVINTKNALPILDNFLLSVSGTTLTIMGSDSETVMTSTIDVLDAEGSGEVAISSKVLLEMIKEIGNQPVTFELNEDTLKIAVYYMNGQFDLMGVNAADYPRREEKPEECKTLEIAADVVRKGIDNTIYAVSQETLRPMMTGIFWDIAEDSITFVASDTHKLVRYINSSVAPGFKGGFILPSKPAAILRNIITDEDVVVNMTVSDRGATFNVGAYSLSCKFIKGNYPNYNRVIPQNNPFHLTVERASLLNAVRRVSLFASKATCLVKIDISENNMHIEGRDIDYSTSAEERVACAYEGNPMTIGFNSGFMTDILQNLKCQEVRISISDPARPGIFEPLTQEENENILVLQMPMQVID